LIVDSGLVQAHIERRCLVWGKSDPLVHLAINVPELPAGQLDLQKTADPKAAVPESRPGRQKGRCPPCPFANNMAIGQATDGHGKNFRSGCRMAIDQNNDGLVVGVRPCRIERGFDPWRVIQPAVPVFVSQEADVGGSGCQFSEQKVQIR